MVPLRDISSPSLTATLVLLSVISLEINSLKADEIRIMRIFILNIKMACRKTDF